VKSSPTDLVRHSTQSSASPDAEGQRSKVKGQK
jgi:hypothetical protein